jgi:hypothetical protein
MGLFRHAGIGDFHMDGVIDSDAIMKTRVPLSNKVTAISVVMEDEIIANLDRISIGIRLATGKVLNRSALIRAILTANLECSTEWTQCPSEAEMIAIIRSRLVINTMLGKKEIKQARAV